MLISLGGGWAIIWGRVKEPLRPQGSLQVNLGVIGLQGGVGGSIKLCSRSDTNKDNSLSGPKRRPGFKDSKGTEPDGMRFPSAYETIQPVVRADPESLAREALGILGKQV